MPLTTRRLAVAIFFIGLFAMAMRVAVDSDTFWHLRAGTWMLDTHRLLNFDAFSHTRLGQPWINHSWLTEIAMAALYRLGGYGALNLATALVVWLTFFFVYRSGAGGSYLRIFVTLLAAVASAVYWSARPQIVSMLLAAVFNAILLDYRRRGVNRLWLLPVLMIAWVNLHGGFAIGFILLTVVFVGALAGLFHQRIEPLRVQRIRDAAWLGGTGLACVLAACLNPYGPAMLLYPFKTVSIGVLQNYIQEWQSPNFHARETQVFILLWLATFGAVGFSRRRLSLTDFLLFSAFSALALLAGRNIAVFAVVAASILMLHGDATIAELQARAPALRLSENTARPARTFLILNWAIVVAVALAAAAKAALPLLPAATQDAVTGASPVGAAAYLRANPPPGLMFNSYNFGGYLTWALYPQTPVYVDGRTDLYDNAFLTDYLNTASAGPGWQA
ncbi:MAG: hypothetical protein HY872_07800, partial [Chloroflexi bacterium]|nr:hypothetical protein [Chloroflexota bacterium]